MKVELSSSDTELRRKSLDVVLLNWKRLNVEFSSCKARLLSCKARFRSYKARMPSCKARLLSYKVWLPSWGAELNQSYLILRSVEAEVKSNKKTNAKFKLSCSNNSISYVNTKARNYICNDKSVFRELIKVEAGHVSFGDNLEIVVKGKCTI